MDTEIPNNVQRTLFTLQNQILNISSTEALKNIRSALEDIATNIEAAILDLEDKIQAKKSSTLWTVKQVADYFNVQPVTVYSWINSGKLETIPTGINKIRISQDAIDRYKQQNDKYRSARKNNK